MSENHEQKSETPERQPSQYFNLLALLNELIDKVARFIVEGSVVDGRWFLLANKLCATITEPHLYSKVDLETGHTRPGKRFWRTIAAKPELGRHFRIFHPREWEIYPHPESNILMSPRGQLFKDRYLVSVSVFRLFPNVREFSCRPYHLGAGLNDEISSGYQVVKHALACMPLLEKLDIEGIQNDLDFTKVMEWLVPLTRLRVLRMSNNQWDDEQDMSKDFAQAALSRCSTYRGTGHATTVDFDGLPNLTWIANFVAWPKRLENLPLVGIITPDSNELEKSFAWEREFKNAFATQRDSLKSLSLWFHSFHVPDVSWLPSLEDYRFMYPGELDGTFERLCERVLAAPSMKRIIIDTTHTSMRATDARPMISGEELRRLQILLTKAHHRNYKLQECRFCFHTPNFDNTTRKGVSQLAIDMKEMGIIIDSYSAST